MMRIRVGTLVGAVLISMLALDPAGHAQTATPTLTPVPTPTCTPRSVPAACRGARLQVSWFTKDPSNARISVSTTGCPLTPSCLAGVANGELVSLPPLTLTIADNDNHQLSKDVSSPGRNMGGCPGGSDTYRGVDRLRLVYGAAMTLIATLNVPLASPTPPTLNAPVALTVRDACGPILNATTNSCSIKASAAVTTIRCSFSPPS
jgi:hypothetical protein